MTETPHPKMRTLIPLSCGCYSSYIFYFHFCSHDDGIRMLGKIAEKMMMISSLIIPQLAFIFVSISIFATRSGQSTQTKSTKKLYTVITSPRIMNRPRSWISLLILLIQQNIAQTSLSIFTPFYSQKCPAEVLLFLSPSDHGLIGTDAKSQSQDNFFDIPDLSEITSHSTFFKNSAFPDL